MLHREDIFETNTQSIQKINRIVHGVINIKREHIIKHLIFLLKALLWIAAELSGDRWSDGGHGETLGSKKESRKGVEREQRKKKN